MGVGEGLFHGEGHALIRAYDKANGQLPSELNMFVDRWSCGTCQSHLPVLAEEMGVTKLNLQFKDGRAAVIENGEFTPLPAR